MGPVEFLVVSFPGNKFKGEVMPALGELVENRILRIIDLVFVMKDADGNVTGMELQDVDEETARVVGPLTDEISGLLSREDIQEVGASLENNSSAAALLFEDVWATRLRDALMNAGGQLVALDRIPGPALDHAIAAQKAS